MPTGLIRGTEIFKAHESDEDFKVEHISKEFVQLFIKMLSVVTSESDLSILCRYVSQALEWNRRSARQLFSSSLNRSLLCILSCRLVGEDAIDAYSRVTQFLSIEQKQLVTASGARRILTALLYHRNASIVKKAGRAMINLTGIGASDFYAGFVEEDVFSALSKHFPSGSSDVCELLVSVADDFPLPACCVPFVTALIEQLESDDVIDSLSAFRCFGRLIRCRGFSCSVIVSFSPILSRL
jgi:hypothetical protein